MNAKLTKLNKNYVVLATLIAALGVIFSLFFAINSFADDTNTEPALNNDANVTYTVSGTLLDTTGNPVEGTEVKLYKSSTEFLTTTSSPSGEFSINVDEETYLVSLTAGSVSGLRYWKGLQTTITADMPLGNLNMYYTSDFVPFVNGAMTEGPGGTWAIVGEPTPVMGEYNLNYKSGSYTISGKVITFNYVDIYGASKTWTWTFTENSGYTFDTIEIIDNPSSVNSNNNLVPGEWKAFNAKTTGGSETKHVFSGKFETPTGAAVSNTTVYIVAGGGAIQTTTNSNGEFSKELTSSDASIKITYLGLDQIGDKTKSSISYHEYGDPLYELTADKNVGTLTCYYACGLMEEINSQYTKSNVYGTWNIPLEANDGGVYTLAFNSCEVSVDENKVKFNYVDEKGGTKEWVWTFTANPGYEFQNFTFNKEDSPVFDNASVVDLTTSLFWGINANVTKIVPKHAVTFDSNTIESVYANGHNLTSGEEVAEGTVLYITPKYPTDAKVTKILVNNAVCPTGVYTLGTSAVNIVADYFDIATITGTVTVDKVVNGQAKINLNKLLVDTAYAAEALEGATVTFTQNSDGWFTSDLTDAEGYFALNVVEHEAGVLTVSKEGYEPFTKEFSAEELEGEVEVAPVLTVASEPENVNGSAQTGDNMPYGIALVVLAISAFAVYRTARRPKGAHVK